MGTFAQLQLTDGVWIEPDGLEGRLERDPTALRIDIHDSDIAALSWPTEDATGLLFFGAQPRHYFGDEDASPPVDVGAEAAALAAWAQATTGTAVQSSAIEALAAPDDPNYISDDVFVEETVARLLPLLGLPLPELLGG